jgi:hypothetical protein
MTLGTLVLASTLLFSAAVAAVPPGPPAIVSVEPAARGTVGGGDVLIIHATGVTFFGDLPKVDFGGVAARRVEVVDSTTLRVTTPAHAQAVVPLHITSAGFELSKRDFIFAGWGSTSGPVHEHYERILVPVAIPGNDDATVPGAFGTRWQTTLSVANASPYHAELFNGEPLCLLLCPSCCNGTEPYPGVEGDQSRSVYVGESPGNGGYLFFLQKGFSADVSFAAHVRDLSRSTENAGTEVAVVRESRFHSEPFDILNVPIDARSRAALRVYDVDTTALAPAATIDISSMSDPKSVLATVRLELSGSRQRPADQLPALANSAVIGDLKAAFPQLPDGRYRLTVTMENGVRGWAFVAVTNNRTQLITTYTPE